MPPDDRLARLLGGEPLAPLRQRLRQRFERASSGTEVQSFRIGRLNATEHAALAALQGRPTRFSASMRVDVASIDAVLRQAGVAVSLRAALEQLDGRIVDRAAERAAGQAQWHDVLIRCKHPALASLLQTSAGIGLLKRLAGRDHAAAARSLAAAEAVLDRLPAHGVTRAQLAANLLGDAHALDTGRAVATLMLAVLRSAQTRDVSFNPEGGATEALSARDLWAGAGVLVNELARPALTLNLPEVAPHGEPAYLSLRRLLRSSPVHPMGSAVNGRTVFICENPNLLAIAADQLGAACAPLVCTEGMPAAAQRCVLRQLAQAGAALRYHGDFDWPGLRIGNQVMGEHGARPWRFGAADYSAALGAAPSFGRLLQGVAVEASWDDKLAATMRAAQQAIDEEMMAEMLLQDLASGGE